MPQNIKAHKKLYGGKELEVVDHEAGMVSLDALFLPADANFRVMGTAENLLSKVLKKEQKDQIQHISTKHGSLKPGSACLIKIKGIKVSHVLLCHIPTYSESSGKRKLEDSIKSSLETASKHGIKTVGIPNIGCGYGSEQDSESTIKGVVDYLVSNSKSSIQKVSFLPTSEDGMYNYLLGFSRME